SLLQLRTQVALEASQPHLVGRQEMIEQPGDAAERRADLSLERSESEPRTRVQQPGGGYAVVLGQHLEMLLECLHVISLAHVTTDANAKPRSRPPRPVSKRRQRPTASRSVVPNPASLPTPAARPRRRC